MPSQIRAAQSASEEKTQDRVSRIVRTASCLRYERYPDPEVTEVTRGSVDSCQGCLTTFNGSIAREPANSAHIGLEIKDEIAQETLFSHQE